MANVEGADDGSHVFGGLDGGEAGDSCSNYEDFDGGYFSGGGHLASKETYVQEMYTMYELSS